MTKVLWTDGSADPNPGPGGFAVLENGKPVRLGREENSTNIRMEGSALIAAIEYAGEEGCEINTDSQKLWGLYNRYPVKLNFVYGHVGTEMNELADEWANRARMGATVSES